MSTLSSSASAAPQLTQPIEHAPLQVPTPLKLLSFWGRVGRAQLMAAHAAISWVLLFGAVLMLGAMSYGAEDPMLIVLGFLVLIWPVLLLGFGLVAISLLLARGSAEANEFGPPVRNSRAVVLLDWSYLPILMGSTVMGAATGLLSVLAAP